MTLFVCNDLSFIFKILGYLFKIIKYIIPVVLIVMATIDIAKIVLNPDDKNKRDTMSNVVKRIIYAIVIYLVPTLVSLLFKILLSQHNPNDYGTGGKAYSESWMSCVADIFT